MTSFSTEVSTKRDSYLNKFYVFFIIFIFKVYITGLLLIYFARFIGSDLMQGTNEEQADTSN